MAGSDGTGEMNRYRTGTSAEQSVRTLERYLQVARRPGHPGRAPT